MSWGGNHTMWVIHTSVVVKPARHGNNRRALPARKEGTLVAVYTLPELPYDYAALEPHISAKIMELHHDKHHATYVAGANTALEKLAEARENGTLAAQANQLEKDLAFHLGGHTNHTRVLAEPLARGWRQARR